MDSSKSDHTHILVIEDHKDVRENIVEILELSGYTVSQAPNGKEGVKLATGEESPDLIICDIMMPEMDGYSVLHILSNRPQTRDVPFIFLSAKSEKDDFRKGMSMGADDYLTKPFDDRELLQAIELRLRRRRDSSESEEVMNENKLQLSQQLNKELDDFWSKAERRYLNKRDVLYIEEERIRYVYRVESGTLKLYKTNDDGKEVVLKLLNPGDMFAISSLLHDGIATESAASMQSSVVLQVPGHDFLLALQRIKGFAASLLKEFAENQMDIEARLLKMAYNSVRKKIAEALLFVYHQKQNTGLGEGMINIMRDDLAGIAGTAKETAIRTLADFKEEKLIAIEDRNIRLLNIKALQNLPN
jgi:CheY-like chemotaxis protein